MSELIKAKLMPEHESSRKDLERLDPYQIRRRGLYEPLSLFELGRALFHINQRRGPNFDRLEGSLDQELQAKTKIANQRLVRAIRETNCLTYGEFLAKRLEAGSGVRARIPHVGDDGELEFFPSRDLLKLEFIRLWEAQARIHEELTSKLKSHLFHVIFYQRPLKPEIIGKCCFFPREDRIAKSSPYFQARRIYHDLNVLRIEVEGAPARALSFEERDTLAAILTSGEDITYKLGLRKHLGIPKLTVVPSDLPGRSDRLMADQTAACLAGKKGPLRDVWDGLSFDKRAELAFWLQSERNEDRLLDYLEDVFGLDPKTALELCAIRLPSGYDRFGLTATKRIIDALKADIIPLKEAIGREFPEVIEESAAGPMLAHLPYYGQLFPSHTTGGSLKPADHPEKRYGRLASPTLHIVFNQLRRIVNALLSEYGNPEQTVLNIAPELKMTLNKRREFERFNKSVAKKNHERLAKVTAPNIGDPRDILRLVRLWEELGQADDRVCVFSGVPITLDDLLSGAVTPHLILPFSRTLDCSIENQTLAFRDANRGKRTMAPAEAFDGNIYEAIVQRAAKLPLRKRMRFGPMAMPSFDRLVPDTMDSVLNDNHLVARLARQYLTGITRNTAQTWVVTGSLTDLLMRRFDLYSILTSSDPMVCTDHRQHAISACVVGVIDRQLVMELQRQAQLNEKDDVVDIALASVPEPFALFREKVEAIVNVITVSHRPDRGLAGPLHTDGNYGIVREVDGDQTFLVRRRPLVELSFTEIDSVRDLALRDRLRAVRDCSGSDPHRLTKALATFAAQNDIRRVRLIKPEAHIALKDKTGKIYRAVLPRNNHHIDLFEDAKGRWRGEGTSLFEAQKTNKTAPDWRQTYPDAHFIMRVHKGDMLELLDEDGVYRIKRIIRLSPVSSKLFLATHYEGGDLKKRNDDKGDRFKLDIVTLSKLKARGCQRVEVTETGLVVRPALALEALTSRARDGKEAN